MNSPYQTSVAMSFTRNGKSALKTGAAVLALTLAISGQALAVPANPQWEGAVSGDWTDGDNWMNGSPPTATDGPVTVAPSASANSPVIDGALGEVDALFLGSLTGANLSIINGGQLSGANVVVGNSTNNAGMTGIADESATLSVAGQGSTLSVNFLTVGYYGDGVLNVTDGAQLLVNSVTSIAPSLGGTGTVTVNGLGSRLEGGSLSIGGDGTGYFEVSEGATAQTTSGAFGVNAGSEGFGTVTGAGTNWAVTDTAITVGGAGLGNLVISDGAVVSSQGKVSIGHQAGGDGTLTFTGAGSSLTAATEFFVGHDGVGEASVTDGAIASGDKVILGFGENSSGALIVDGASSLVQGTTYVMIGYGATGEATISNGGTLKADGARGITIGFQAGSSGVLNIGAASGDAAVAAGYIDAVSGIKFGEGSGRLVLNHTNSDYILAAPLVGGGQVLALSGTTILTGDSSNFAGTFSLYGGNTILAGATNAATTVIGSDGVLQIGNGGTSGSLNSDIVNDGLLVFNRSDALHHNRVISASGALTVAGGFITLSGMNTFTGATNIDDGATLALSGQGRINQSSNVNVDGTFDVRAASSASIKDLSGSGTIVLGDAGLMIADASQEFSGRITGTGGMNVGAGTLTLTGESDFEGGLGISNNTTVNIGAGGTTGSITANVTNYGALIFDRLDDVVYGGQITGQGSVLKTGANTVTFTGAMSGVQLNVEEGTALFLGAISNNALVGAEGTLVFANPGTTTYKGALTGTGLVVKSGAGTTNFSGNSAAFAGSATIEGGTLLLTGTLDGTVEIQSAGTLQVGNAKKDGNLLGDVVNNGTLIFNQIEDYDYAGALSGNGGLIKQGAGILLLSGDYRYTGSTVVEDGLVQLSSQLDVNTDLVVDGGTFDLGGRDQEVAGLSGASGTLSLGAGALTVVQSGSSSFGGEIAGSGGFIKDGAGSLNLTGTSSFSGQVDVNGGRLAVNGLLPGNIIVNGGGTLGGSGTAGAVIIRNGGTLAPGNSIGTLAVTGDVQFDAGSVYQVEVDAAGNSDRINATGSATINGGTVSVLAAAGTYRSTSDYVILKAADGVTGRFGDKVDIDLPFLTPFLGYSADEVTLTLIRNDRSFASVAGTPNQMAVALALDTSNRNSGLYRAVAGQSDEAGAVQAFNALSGELWATAGTFMVDRTRRIGELVIGRMEQADIISHALSNSGSASRQTLGGTGIWGQATGSWNIVKGNGNASRATQSGAGFVTGVDTLLGDWRIGAAFSHSEDKVRVNGLGSEATVTGSALAAYLGGGWQNLRVRIGGSYGWLDVKGQRTVAFPSVSETVAANYDGKSASAFAEVSYAASFGRAQVEPFAGVNYVHLRTDGFAETAGALGALGVARQTRDVTYTTLGLRLGAVLPVSDEAAITPRVSAAWLRGFGDLGAQGRHSLTSGQAFTIEGLPATRNALHVEAGAQANIMPGGSLGISYVGNMADRWSDHGLRLGFSYSF